MDRNSPLLVPAAASRRQRRSRSSLVGYEFFLLQVPTIFCEQEGMSSNQSLYCFACHWSRECTRFVMAGRQDPKAPGNARAVGFLREVREYVLLVQSIFLEEDF